MAGVEVTAVTSPSPISEEVEQRLSIHQLLLLAESVTSEYFAGEVEPVWLATGRLPADVELNRVERRSRPLAPANPTRHHRKIALPGVLATC